MTLEHPIGLKVRDRPETNAGVLASAYQTFAVFGKGDGLRMSPVGVNDNRLCGRLGSCHDAELHLLSLMLALFWRWDGDQYIAGPHDDGVRKLHPAAVAHGRRRQ